MIGHAIGFDCAVLARECSRIGKTWQSPLTLDTQMLAQIAEPELAGYSLEKSAAWLGVEIINRHSALGDATAAAQIFCALVPRLRERGIRTLGEATRACRGLTNMLDQQHSAGWAESASTENAPTGQRGERVDTYPYRHRVGAIMTAPAKSIGSEAPLGAALERLMRERTSSLFVFSGPGDGPVLPDQAGIVTERDVLRAFDAHGAAALTLPVRQVMSKPLLADTG